MADYSDWFGVDVSKRAALVRSRTLPVVVKELLANCLDAGASHIELTCQPAKGKRRDGDGLRAFEVICVDDGRGCDDPEILRRVGSSTSDLHAETRGRFGQGLIDVLAIADTAGIRTLKHRISFDSKGCRIRAIRNGVNGLSLDGVIRHGGDGFDDLGTYFNSVILPHGVTVFVNGKVVGERNPTRTIADVRLRTVTYDPQSQRVRRHPHSTAIEIHHQHGAIPMIHELGIPVDSAPWSLPFDINVLQKTPLDVERNMLPAKYKDNLISQLVAPLSDEFQRYMAENDDAPPEIKNDRDNAVRLNEEAQKTLVETVTGAEADQIVRRDPFDPDDMGESQELEYNGYTPINRGSLPAGVSEVLKESPTVAETHDRVCKPHLREDPNFPVETERQRQCMAAFEEIASALLGKPVKCDRIGGSGASATWSNNVIRLNINVDHIWCDPLGEESLGIIVHECTHDKVSGHAEAFINEQGRLSGRLARWVAGAPERWRSMTEALYSAPHPEVQGAR